MKYKVTFVQYHEYYVEAEDETEAEDIAYKEFQTDMRRPVAKTWWDDIEVEEREDDSCLPLTHICPGICAKGLSG